MRQYLAFHGTPEAEAPAPSRSPWSNGAQDLCECRYTIKWTSPAVTIPAHSVLPGSFVHDDGVTNCGKAGRTTTPMAVEAAYKIDAPRWYETMMPRPRNPICALLMCPFCTHATHQTGLCIVQSRGQIDVLTNLRQSSCSSGLLMAREACSACTRRSTRPQAAVMRDAAHHTSTTYNAK